MNTLYYLNNTGERWIILDNDNRRVKVEVLSPEGEVIATRRAKYFFQHGNYAGVVIRLNNKVFKTLNYRLV